MNKKRNYVILQLDNANVSNEIEFCMNLHHTLRKTHGSNNYSAKRKLKHANITTMCFQKHTKLASKTCKPNAIHQ